MAGGRVWSLGLMQLGCWVTRWGMVVFYVYLVTFELDVVCCQRMTACEADQEDQLLSAAECSDEKESGTACCVSRGWGDGGERTKNPSPTRVDIAMQPSSSAQRVVVWWCSIETTARAWVKGRSTDRNKEHTKEKRSREGSARMTSQKQGRSRSRGEKSRRKSGS